MSRTFVFATILLLLMASGCSPVAGMMEIDAGGVDGALVADAGLASDAGGDAEGGPMDVGSVGADGGDPADAGTQFDGGQEPPDGGHVSGRIASVGVAKVKLLLTGLPATDEEVARVVASAGVMSELVSEWMQLPQYQEKMRRFFTTSLQQDQWSYDELALYFCQLPPFSGHSKLFVQNLQEVMARTTMQLIAEGQPFTSVLTTRRFMMTPAVMAAYATLDSRRISDNYICRDMFHLEHPSWLTIQSTTPVSFEESINPASGHFMSFYDPGLRDTTANGCPGPSVTFADPVDAMRMVNYLFNGNPGVPGHCYMSRPVTSVHMKPEDFTDWHMVEVRRPQLGEWTTPLYDLPSMRRGDPLLLRVPRVGFFTTPAFMTRWPTNDSNLARVLINQTMIVALGESIGLRNTTAPPSLAALDRVHAAPETDCYQCHQSLDPMRQFFRQAYSIYQSDQDDLWQRALPGQFGFHGVSASGTDITHLGTILASHPMFAPAWVQKLCTWATSQPCDDGDPEFQRLVQVFIQSNHSWNALVRALFSSPLVTNFFRTESEETIGIVTPVARQAHLCGALSARLGVHDICARDVMTVPFSEVTATVASSWPSLQYSRGSDAPEIPIVPSLFTRGGAESICVDLADKLVDAEGSVYRSDNVSRSLDVLTGQLMGLTSDRRAAPRALLQEHFDEALLTGATPDVALKSTFVLACLSPFVTAVGQ